MESETFRFHRFQDLAFEALQDDQIREIALIGGIQSGKTIFGAIALRELVDNGSKEQSFIVGAPTYPILQQSTLPTFKKIFTPLMGRYNAQEKKFILKKGGFIYFRTSTDPDQVEGIPDCAHAWVDEAGKCSRLFKINVSARIARLKGKIIYTSTPYAMNWLWTEVIKPYQDGERRDVFYTQFTSADNPSFPKEEFERQRLILDPRTFRRKYMGLHEKMEGLVYESLGGEHLIEQIPLPKATRYFAGVDFGYVEGHEFALIVRAITPDAMHYDISEFKQAHLDPNDQVQIARAKAQSYKIECFYCDPARPDMIATFNKAGLRAQGFYQTNVGYQRIIPGIQKHNQIIREGKYKVFKRFCPAIIDEYETYHWPTSIDGEIKSEVPVAINDHLMDATRYVTIGTLHLSQRREKISDKVAPSVRRDTFDLTKSRRTPSWDSF